MLCVCARCEGFLPPGSSTCPHCGAKHAGPRTIAKKLRDAAIAVAAGAASMTLMACYGGGYVETACQSDSDCALGQQCVSNLCQQRAPENCTNGVDDNGDGRIDCQDITCNCTFEVSCTNGIDDDADGLVDCADPDCSGICTATEICNDGVDNDHNGLTDCQDPACGCSFESNCTNGVDDDGDGYVDCQDPDCSSQCALHEMECMNGMDDDADGLVDCADPDCATDSACGGHETDCNDGVDDDKDGLTDCQDGDCPACPSVETSCTNGFDDDQDGLADCADPDCAASCASTCGDGVRTPSEECDDGNTVDGDGCSATCFVEDAVFCSSLPALGMGANVGSTSDGTAAFDASCIAPGGPESAYAFTPAVDGTLYLTLDAATNLGVYVDLGCGDISTELACADVAPAGALEALSIAVPAGAPITIFVDGKSEGTAGDFTLLANFVPAN